MDLLHAMGYVGQAFFGGRVVYQWAASERAGRVVVPRGYWGLSLVGSALVLAYGVGRHNLVFVMSVLPGTVIAYLNLRIREKARKRELFPWAVALVGVVVWAAWKQPRVGDGVIWAVIGLVGSLLWGLRHVFQWWVSQRRGEPTLPLSFYLLSLAGSIFLLVYAIKHLDPVMIVGYAFNCVPYIRILRLLRAPRGAAARSS
jgi:lipid-A-disaccharide synthase-like uncharacterized protein